jgi:Zn-finger nucleic acid-binding protein
LVRVASTGERKWLWLLFSKAVSATAGSKCGQSAKFIKKQQESNYFMPLELDDRGRALENEYFRNKEKELLEKMKAKLQSVEAKPTALQCPRGDGTLHETNFENIKIEVCDTCHGVWLDASELAQVTHKEEGWFDRFFG